MSKTAAPSINSYHACVGKPAKILGEIITWNCQATVVPFSKIVLALADLGLDATVARELAPRHAFARAARKLARDRIIRQIDEDENYIEFQFTKETREKDRFEYTLETVLTLEKKTGKVECEIAGLAAHAQELLDQAVCNRTASDVTRIIQRLFERHADLFPIREKGGAYFVPECHLSYVEDVQQFMGMMGGVLHRFPVPMGTVAGDTSVRASVKQGIESLLDELNRAVEEYTADTRGHTFERAAERLSTIKFKIEAYTDYLGEVQEELRKTAEELRGKILAKIDEKEKK